MRTSEPLSPPTRKVYLEYVLIINIAKPKNCAGALDLPPLPR
jgi:hypothetical protein